jgi:hypothetical protein
MTRLSYPYEQTESWRYIFVSVGNRKIEKVVDFVAIEGNMVNLGFGDLLPDGSIDDKANSNNGDIINLLATIIDILKDFSSQYPFVQIAFRGSTPERTKLYGRILQTYYPIFVKEFEIAAVPFVDGGIKVLPYDPKAQQNYLAFLIKRI